MTSSKRKVKTATNAIELVPVGDLIPADYNPRETVSERLDQVVNSIKYLGFVLPLYVRDDNRLLSGHQRIKAAVLAGYTHVPVVRFNPSSKQEKGFNIMFNKGTNDYTGKTGAEAFQQFVEANHSLLDGVDEAPIDSFPCMNVEHVDIDVLYEKIGDVSIGVRAAAQVLVHKKMWMPIVARRDNTVINGISRLWNMKAYGYTSCDVVYVDDDRAEFAHLCLNLLAMDFDLRKTFYDRLRFNAYRRLTVDQQNVNCSRGYTFWAFDKKFVKQALWVKHIVNDPEGLKAQRDLSAVMPHHPGVRKKYRKVFGQHIVDMGAGTFHDANLLNRNGFHVMPWEPYCLTPDGGHKVSPERSRKETHRFLDEIEEVAQERGRFPDSVVSSFNLNSIPHHEDRVAFLTICHALCGLKTPFYLSTQSVKGMDARKAEYLNPNMEPNMVLGMGLSNFKTQKYFYKEELEGLLKVFWIKVEVIERSGNLLTKCTLPKARRANLLSEALALEFDMPFEDGSTLDAVDRAKQVFSKLTALDLK